MQALRRRRSPVPAHTLARELDVSLRSVYRDIATLRGQGAAIEGEAGLGYVLEPGFLLPPLMFDDDELEAIVLGLRLAGQYGDDGIGRAAKDVLAKLRAVLPRDLRAMLDDTGVMAGAPAQRPAETVDAALIRKTIRESRKASIQYLDGKDRATLRTIWPLALSFWERSRMVVAWCELRTDYRCFRVDRMKVWAPLAERIERSRTAMLAEWMKREGIPG